MRRPATDQLLPGRIVAGKYEIGDVIGRGAHGCVYEATHLTTGRRLALKQAHWEVASTAELRERFEREARAIGRLEHPNIVEVIDFGEDDGVPFIVMERLAGASLGDLLDDLSPSRLTVAETRAILWPVIDAMATAHASGVLHRDLKPSNIMVRRLDSGEYDVRVVDFGLAKVPELAPITLAGAQIGTPLYMAPEVIRGDGAVAASDVWSMGVLLYRCLSGSLPFDGDTVADVSRRVLANERRALERAAPDPLPRALVDLVERALAPHPNRRWSDMGALRDAWEADRDRTVGEVDPMPTLDERRRAMQWSATRVVAVAGVSRDVEATRASRRGSDFDDVETVRTVASQLEATLARPVRFPDDAPLPPLVEREGLETGGSLPGLPTFAQFTQPERPASAPPQAHVAPRSSFLSWIRRLLGRS